MAIKIALAGNPNCGKTTLFNDLTGSNQYVGNWPGVTVEKKEGRLKGHKDVVIQDLPGIYSLSPYTLEEVVARGYLVGEKPDVILNIIDGTNIERNLYLTTQLIELGIPVVMAVNMIDLVRKNGDTIDLKRLSRELGCEAIEISALKGEGSRQAAQLAVEAARESCTGELPHVFTGSVEHALAHIEESIQGKVDERFLRWYAVKLFERDDKVQSELGLDAGLLAHLDEHIADCEKEMDDDAESIITNQRYAYIHRVVSRAVQKKARTEHLTVSDKIDRIVTNRILALPIFAVIMAAIYTLSMGSSNFAIGRMATDWTNDVLFGDWVPNALNAFLEGAGVAPWLQGLVVDGIVAGVGAVLGFVPQMLVLFLMLSLLEDVGYMARVAFIMDRIFRKFGLSGKSFIPMLVGTGCGVPGVMASRTIENERDRRMTIMTTCFIPCSAKMPIIGLFAGALFGGSGLVATSAYFIGMAAIIVSGVILKKTRLFAGDPAPFVMELPAYHVPAWGNVLRATWERGWSFIKRAGTVILASTIVLWFLQGFGFTDGTFGMVEDNNTSLLAGIGGAVSWLFAPLGFASWQATVATVTGLIAKENVVGTFGVLYGFAEVAENGDEIWANIARDFTMLSAYSFMIFNLLCAPCFAAMGAIKREMNNGRWTAIAIGYMCLLAYCTALVVYQLGGLVTGEVGFNFFTVVALALVALAIFLLVRPNPYEKERERVAPSRATVTE
ncbi:ferrous iron transport protein B [Subdoligranulum variabile]|uniref:Ferrous iron transport protein B n=1 Tax=Subdoligranulum variabile DSM 15176 TaxID=411471 RepID=D1PII1_9FIRM|nr:ferrous iron transport protein B [Subdoligranulum variabile]EFB77340.1 ferrous iron transport protein B [Subdoligranulum variabile DSM 15176]UWP67239.1 ferrous iron transport protein B [Subdoligranulum variabile]